MIDALLEVAGVVKCDSLDTGSAVSVAMEFVIRRLVRCTEFVRFVVKRWRGIGRR